MGQTPDSPTTSQPPARTTDKEVLMKQYEIMVDAYLKYLEILLKFTLFSYAVTGAILSFHLTQKHEGIMRFGLVFPVTMNLAFSVFTFFAAQRTQPIADEINWVIGQLGLGAYPDAAFLKFVLLVLGALFTIIAIGLVILSFAR